MTFNRIFMTLPLLAALSLPVLSLTALADDRMDHFSGKPSNTLSQAVSNFTEGNQELRKLLQGDASYDDLAQIHRLSYTLENALGKLNEEMQTLAVILEQIHLASETGKKQAVKGNGAAYFEIVDTLELGGDL